MNSAVLCFLFLVILVNDICIFAKLGFKYKIHSAAIMGRLSGPGWNARPKLRLRLLANLQELRLMMFLGQKFPSSSLPWSAKPRTQRIHKLRVHRWSWRIGVTRKSKSKSRLIWAYIYIYIFIYQKAWPIRPINFWLEFKMKLLNSNMHETHSVFIISAIETIALQKYNSMSADEKRGLVAKYIAGGGIKSNLQQILSNVESSSSSKGTPSQVIEGYMSLGIVEVYFLFPLNNFYGLYITLRPLLWGVMHRVNSFLWRDPAGSHMSYRHICIYIYIIHIL